MFVEWLLEKFVTSVELFEVSVAFKATVKFDSESAFEDILFGAERTFSAFWAIPRDVIKNRETNKNNKFFINNKITVS